MSSVVVVVADVIGKKPLQVLLVDRNHMVEQVPATTLDPALCTPVLLWALVRGLYGSNLHGSHGSRNFQSVFCVSVKYQKAWGRIEREGLSQLLHDPHGTWVLGGIEMQDPPSVMTDHKEAVNHAERDRWDREEIHCSDRFAMVPKEREPAFSRFRISGRASHPARDGSLGDIETEHEQLAVNARCAPRRVLGNHAEDQVANFFRKSFPPFWLSTSGDQPPIQTEAVPVPSHDCFWRDYNQRVFPRGPNPLRSQPKQFVEGIQFWSRMAVLEHGELLP